jgi:hypothetical protein
MSAPVYRIFTIEEVDSLIPELNRLMGQQLSLKVEIERVLGELAEELGEIPASLAISDLDTDRVKRLKADLGTVARTYNDNWGRFQSLGAVVKDPQIGLLDFYGRIDGRTVWLCWRFGEEKVGYYHELDAGFGGRRALGEETRTKLIN